MNNKKIIIIVLIFIICVSAIAFGIFKATHNENYLYNQNGQIEDSKASLINKLKSVEDKDERKKQVDFALEQNLISQDEANDIY